MLAPMTPRQALRQWLDGFAACVRARDFARGRTFFHRRAHGFGSYADICWDLDDLVRRQWKQIWPNITGFRFDQRRLHYLISPDRRLMGAMLPWRSTGFHPDGRRFLRNGRVTIILSRERGGRWVARHTHYSLNPGTSQTTVRRRG